MDSALYGPYSGMNFATKNRFFQAGENVLRYYRKRLARYAVPICRLLPLILEQLLLEINGRELFMVQMFLLLPNQCQRTEGNEAVAWPHPF